MTAATPDPADLPSFLRAWLDGSSDNGAPCDWCVGEPSVVVITRETFDSHAVETASDDLDDAEDFAAAWSMTDEEHQLQREAAARAALDARERRRTARLP